MSSFAKFSLIAIPVGFIISVLSLFMTGAGHHPHIEIVLVFFKLGLIVMGIGALCSAVSLLTWLTTRKQ